MTRCPHDSLLPVALLRSAQLATTGVSSATSNETPLATPLVAQEVTGAGAQLHAQLVSNSGIGLATFRVICSVAQGIPYLGSFARRRTRVVMSRTDSLRVGARTARTNVRRKP